MTRGRDLPNQPVGRARALRAERAGPARVVFSDGLLRHLAPEGWKLLDAGVVPPGALVALSKPLDREFAAVAELQAVARGAGGSFPVDLFSLTAGIAYEPLRRLWPVLGTYFAGALVRADAAQLLGAPRAAVQTIDESDDAEPIIAELAALIPPATAALGRRLLSVDALLTGVRLDRLKQAALLAVIGQFDAAAEALTRFVPIPSASPAARIRERHTIEQLEAWIDTRDPSKLAQAPVFEPPVPPSEPPLHRRIPVVTRALWRHYRR